MRRLLGVLAGESGYGMVSVLIAIVLLSVGVVVLSSSSVFLSSLKNEASVRSVAATVALTYMEELKTRERVTLASEDPLRVNEKGEPDENGAFLRVLEVSSEPSVVESVRLRIKVGYPGHFGRAMTVEVVTIIYVGE
jgi:hypothetical protein